MSHILVDIHGSPRGVELRTGLTEWVERYFNFLTLHRKIHDIFSNNVSRHYRDIFSLAYYWSMSFLPPVVFSAEQPVAMGASRLHQFSRMLVNQGSGKLLPFGMVVLGVFSLPPIATARIGPETRR